MATKSNYSSAELDKPLSDTPTIEDSTVLWLALHFSQLPVEVFARGENVSAVVITNRQRIVAMNDIARSSGLRDGSTMDTAYSICENVKSFEKNETREIAALSQLAQTAYQFTPSVSVRAPNSLILDISGCTKLWGGLQPMLERIRLHLETLGYFAWFGVSCTPMSALCMARWAMKQGSEQAPVLAVDQVENRFGPVDIDCLEAGPDVIDGLSQMGVVSLEGLFRLPESGVRRRFGVYFSDYLERLRGLRPDPQKFIGEMPAFMSDINFLSDVTNIQSLAFPAKRLLTELCEFLHARQLQINRFTFRLAHRSHPSVEFSVYLANPDNDMAMFQMLAQLKLENIDNMPEVDNIALTTSVFYPADRPSGDLFEGTRFRQKDGTGSSKADRDNANRLINMLRARLGPNTCFGLSEANDHRPEKAWKPVRLNERDYWSSPALVLPDSRPFFLLPEPKPLNVVNNAPVLNGAMQMIRGPERIDFGWWDNNTSARDYFVCRQSCGSLYWVFKHMQSGKWFLHGVFS